MHKQHSKDMEVLRKYQNIALNNLIDIYNLLNKAVFCLPTDEYTKMVLGIIQNQIANKESFLLEDIKEDDLKGDCSLEGQKLMQPLEDYEMQLLDYREEQSKHQDYEYTRKLLLEEKRVIEIPTV